VPPVESGEHGSFGVPPPRTGRREMEPLWVVVLDADPRCVSSRLFGCQRAESRCADVRRADDDVCWTGAFPTVILAQGARCLKTPASPCVETERTPSGHGRFRCPAGGLVLASYLVVDLADLP